MERVWCGAPRTPLTTHSTIYSGPRCSEGGTLGGGVRSGYRVWTWPCSAGTGGGSGTSVVGACEGGSGRAGGGAGGGGAITGVADAPGSAGAVGDALNVDGGFSGAGAGGGIGAGLGVPSIASGREDSTGAGAAAMGAKLTGCTGRMADGTPRSKLPVEGGTPGENDAGWPPVWAPAPGTVPAPGRMPDVPVKADVNWP
jgi:hypothetical protein